MLFSFSFICLTFQFLAISQHVCAAPLLRVHNQDREAESQLQRRTNQAWHNYQFPQAGPSSTPSPSNTHPQHDGPPPPPYGAHRSDVQPGKPNIYPYVHDKNARPVIPPYIPPTPEDGPSKAAGLWTKVKAVVGIKKPKTSAEIRREKLASQTQAQAANGGR